MRIVLFGQAIIHHPVRWSDEVRAIAAGADAVFCNFESCLPPQGAWPMKSKTVHAAHPDALAMLADLGVTHLGTANNHAWDFGHAGLLETRRRAEAAGFAVAGTGVDAREAWRPAVRNGVAVLCFDAGPTPGWAVAGNHPGVAGLGVRRALKLTAEDIEHLTALDRDTHSAERRQRRLDIGYDRPGDATGPLGLDMEEAETRGEVFRIDDDAVEKVCDAIAKARREADHVIVHLHYHHWSPDWISPPAWMGDLRTTLAAAGADAVVGTGPPFALPVEIEGGRAYAPGLGNLVFHTRRAEAYDRLGLPVWQGQAAVFDGTDWRAECFATPTP